MRGLVSAWGRILRRLHPGAFHRDHPGVPAAVPGLLRLRRRAPAAARRRCAQLGDYKGDELVERTLALVREHRPLHLSIIGGEPLVRFRELDEILPACWPPGHLHAGRHQRRAADPGRVGRDPEAEDRGVDRRPAARTRCAARAGDLRADPEAHRGGADHRALHGHAPAGAAARLPARVRAHVVGGARVTRQIWVSLYTPQIGEVSEERLTPELRAQGREPNCSRCGPSFPSSTCRGA